MRPIVVPDRYTRGKNSDRHGRSNPVGTTKFSYGTAGFRTVATELTFIAFRCGYLAGLRSQILDKTIGIMITASHNPENDNGIKIVDPNGEMLAAEWEQHATELINASDEDFTSDAELLKFRYALKNKEGHVVVGMDTRNSSSHLKDAVLEGVKICGATCVDVGIVTTPQLHFIVRCKNDPSFGTASENGYYEKIAKSFNKLIELIPGKSMLVTLDCANGVGARKMRTLLSHLVENKLAIDFRNEGEGKEDFLNQMCGADYVKIEQKLPANCKDPFTTSKCASFDGDADRLVYFTRFADLEDKALLLDGDKIAVLITKYIMEQLVEARLDNQLSIGIVQTAYANGASTKYIVDTLGVSQTCVRTGVKHLHHAAQQYDIGVYFEANGHGTVVFSKKFNTLVREAPDPSDAIKRLKHLSHVINEVVGDAMADLLVVELILRRYDWRIRDWEQNLYTDLPNVQRKVEGVDRLLFKASDDEQTLLEPKGLQEKIDKQVKKYPGGRSFVRPSGTENIVRVYAEADTVASAEALAQAVEEIVKNYDPTVEGSRSGCPTCINPSDRCVSL